MEDMLMIRRIPARYCPACFSTLCPRSAVFRTSRIHSPTPIRMPESHGANAEPCPAHARASGLDQGGPILRSAAPRAHCTLSLLRHRRRAIARGLDGHDPKTIYANAKTCRRVSEIRAILNAEARESPRALNNETKGKNMSATESKKTTAATSETIDEIFHEAMRSYEKALKSGIQMQEESVNLWKDLLTKLGYPEELQAKLEAMTADVFPKARKRMEEFVETFNRTSNQTIDLFEKTLGVYQATSVPDAQRRMQDLIESSLAALRVNVRSALDTNAKIIASWQELADRFGPAVKK